MLGMDGLWGWQGWQWLFLIEGVPSVLFGVILYYWLTDRPVTATWLSPVEKDWLQNKLDSEASVTHQADDFKQSDASFGRLEARFVVLCCRHQLLQYQHVVAPVNPALVRIEQYPYRFFNWRALPRNSHYHDYSWSTFR